MNLVSMKFKEYISKNQVFTIDALYANLDSTNSISKSITRAVESGQIERVRRGLYVSKTGRFTGETCDPRLVVKTADPKAFLVYHSALELHGVAHNVSFTVMFRSDAVSKGFFYDGITYVRYPFAEGLTQAMRIDALDRVAVTTKEQTLIDCMKHPPRSGGSEEVIRSLSALPYLDSNALDELLSGASASLIARVGWLLDANLNKWDISEDLLTVLKKKLGSGPYRLDNQSRHSLGWSNEWKLCFPETKDEVMSWTK